MVSNFFSVEYPPSIIFAISIILLSYGIFNCYQTNAELTARVQELAMQISILNDDNARLKDMLLKDKLDTKKDEMKNKLTNDDNLEN